MAGKTLQVVRGEFHRHTEISGDGGGDGTIFDMWRYGLDMAALDWLGSTKLAVVLLVALLVASVASGLFPLRTNQTERISMAEVHSYAL